jgi:hypothetical protein
MKISFIKSLTKNMPGKEFSIVDGKLKSKSQGVRTKSKCRVLEFESLGKFGEFIKRLDGQFHMTAGTSEYETSILLSKHEYKTAGEPSVISHDGQDIPVVMFGNDHLRHRKQPGLMVVDSDAMSAQDAPVWEVLLDVCPEIRRFTRLECSSTSAFIYDKDGNELKGRSGQHTYLHVEDTTDISRALEALHKRAVIRGYAKPRISESGEVLIRSIVDCQLRVPSQPIYLYATCYDGLTQRKAINLFESDIEVLCTADVIPNITDSEQDEYEEISKRLKEDWESQAGDVRETYINRKAAETLIRNPDMTPSKARDTIEQSLTGGTLEPDFEIKLTDGTYVRVADITADPEFYHEKTCYDPFDTESLSATCAKIYTNEGHCILSSFAHTAGEQPRTYLLREGDPFAGLESKLMFGDESSLSAITENDPHANFFPETAQSAMKSPVIAESTPQNVEKQPVKDPSVETRDQTELRMAILSMKPPELSQTALYGILGRITAAATENSEATVPGVAAGMIARIAAGFGRPFYFRTGDELVSPNVFLIQVGESATARKGTSAAAPRVIHEMICMLGKNQHELLSGHEDSLAEVKATLARAQANREEIIKGHEHLLHLAGSPLEIVELGKQAQQLEQGVAGLKASLETSQADANKHFGKPYYKIASNALAESEAMLRDRESLLEESKSMLVKVARVASDRGGVDADYLAALAAADQTIAGIQKNLSGDMMVQSSISKALLSYCVNDMHVMTSCNSGEGLINQIRDPREVTQGGEGEEAEIDPGVSDKRVLLDVSEFGSILSVCMRTGNNLSAVLRDMYDCRPLSTGTKNSPIGCLNPYGSLFGSVTWPELMGLLFSAKDISANSHNGLANRPLYLHAARTKLVAIPKASRSLDAFAREIFDNLSKVYSQLNIQGDVSSQVEFVFTPEAEAAWGDTGSIYKKIALYNYTSSRARAFAGRYETNCRKIAITLAIMNGKTQVDLETIEAASAWITYAMQTIDYGASTEEARATQSQLEEDSQLMLSFIRGNGGEVSTALFNRGERALRSNKRVKEVANYLAKKSPSPISITKQGTQTIISLAKGGN